MSQPPGNVFLQVRFWITCIVLLLLVPACGYLAIITSLLLVRMALTLMCFVFLVLVAFVIFAARVINRTYPPPEHPCPVAEEHRCFHPYNAPTALLPYAVQPLGARPPPNYCPQASPILIRQVPLRAHGLALAARMTVVRLTNGALWVHFPVALEGATRAALSEFGEVRYVVAPAWLVHSPLWVREWQEAFPRARFYAAPGLPARHPELQFDGTLDQEPAGGWPWADEISTMPLPGCRPGVTECLFCHRPTHTLLVTQAVICMGPEAPWITRCALRALMMYRRPGPPTVFKESVDRALLRPAIGRVLADPNWRFERIIVAHGRLVDTDARQIFRDAFAFAFL